MERPLTGNSTYVDRRCVTAEQEEFDWNKVVMVARAIAREHSTWNFWKGIWWLRYKATHRESDYQRANQELQACCGGLNKLRLDVSDCKHSSYRC